MLVDNQERRRYYDNRYAYYCDDALRIDREIVRYRPIFIDIYTEIKDWCARLQSISHDEITLVVENEHPRYAREGRFDYKILVGQKFRIDLSFAEMNSFPSVGDYIGAVINEYIRAIDMHVQQMYSDIHASTRRLPGRTAINPHQPTWDLRGWRDEFPSRVFEGYAPQMSVDWSYETVREPSPSGGWFVSKTAERENEKAKKLLWSCLSRKQKKMYKQDKTFIAIGNVTGTKYLIRNQTQINIVQLDDDGNWVEKLCTVPTERIPVEDHQLAQKLMIETEEDVFLDKVIRWSI